MGIVGCYWDSACIGKLLQSQLLKHNSIDCHNIMYIILDKPSLTFKKPSLSLLPPSTKHITVYTNQLQTLTHAHIVHHLVINNKLSVFGLEYSVSNMSNIVRERYEWMVCLRTADFGCNFVVDLLLERGEDLATCKIEFPVILQFKVVKLETGIYSLTKSLSIDRDFKIINKIGEGSFAQIYLAREEGTEKLRAIKTINKQRCIRLGELNFIANQVAILKQLPSPWNVELYYVFQDNKYVNIVMEFCPYGDLYVQIAKKSPQLTVFTKYVYFIQICLGIVRLHQKGYIYRDLKPENILIDCRGNAKLCDFGYSRKYRPDELCYEMCGSYEYLPPEMISKQGYNHSFDIYCLGLLFYEMMTGVNPFKGITAKNMEDILSRKIDFQVEGILPSTKDLIKKMLQKDPKKRIGYKSSTEIFQHEFFIENSQLVIRILKGQKLINRETSGIMIRNIIPRKETKEDMMSMLKNSVPMLFGGKFYNYMMPGFDVVDKMGPKMVQGDSKGNRGEEHSE